MAITDNKKFMLLITTMILISYMLFDIICKIDINQFITLMYILSCGQFIIMTVIIYQMRSFEDELNTFINNNNNNNN